MSTLAASDAFVVNRAGVNYQVTAANLMSTIADTDLFVVNRAAVNYQVTGLDVKAYFAPAASSGVIIPKAERAVNASMYANAKNPIVWNGTYYFLYVQRDPAGPLPSPSWRRSTDGVTWTDAGGTTAAGPQCAALPTGTLLGCATNGLNDIYRSTDNGMTWTSVLTNVDTRGYLVYNPTSAKALFMSDGTTYESTNDGLTWLASSNGISTIPTTGYFRNWMFDYATGAAGAAGGFIVYDAAAARYKTSDSSGLNFTNSATAPANTFHGFITTNAARTVTLTCLASGAVRATTNNGSTNTTLGTLTASAGSGANACGWSSLANKFVMISNDLSTAQVPTPVNGIFTSDGTNFVDITANNLVRINPTNFSVANGQENFLSGATAVIYSATIP